MLVASHFVGDWIFQSRSVALTKSKLLKSLLIHVALVTVALLPAAAWYAYYHGVGVMVWALSINAVLHAVQDWYGWRWYGRQFATFTDSAHFNNPWLWRQIAIDQTIHLVVLVLLFGY